MDAIHKRIPVHRDHNDEPVYWEPEIRAVSTTVIDLPGDGMLAVIEEDITVQVVLFEFACGPTFKNGIEIEPRAYQRIMHGSGPSGSLRELRHTFWGEPENSGYIHYPSAELITAAFKALERWFDCD